VEINTPVREKFNNLNPTKLIPAQCLHYPANQEIRAWEQTTNPCVDTLVHIPIFFN
jgi:hypothetical protein